MTAHPIHLLWAAPIAFGAGWAAQRASLCNVRAVADWIDHRDGRQLATLLRASLWATAATGVLWAAGLATPVQAAPMGTGAALLGGLLFGLGAALNQGCSLSTLIRLAEGQWRLLLTLLGFVLGARLGFETLALADTLGALRTVAQGAWPGWATVGTIGLLIVVGGTLFDVFRHVASAHPRRAEGRWWQQPAWPRRHTAWVFGLAGAAMYGGYGAWTYTNLLRTQATGQGGAALGAQVALVVALLAGMVLAAWRAGAWRRRASPAPTAPARHLLGGLLMGVGSLTIPGGNDSVLLSWVPALSADGAVAYLGMLAGIGGPAWMRRRQRRRIPGHS